MTRARLLSRLGGIEDRILAFFLMVFMALIPNSFSQRPEQWVSRPGYRFRPLVVDGWYDCGTPESLLETNRFLLARDGNLWSGGNSILIPPVFIPDNAEISHSIIGPNVSVGEGAIIDHSLISDSIIGSNARVIRASLVGSLIGDNAEIIERPRRLSVGANSSLDFDMTEM